MEDSQLYQEVERARLALLAAFRRLRSEARLAEADFQAILGILKELDSLPREELAERLAALLPPDEVMGDTAP